MFDHIVDWPEFRDDASPSRARIGHDKVPPKEWRSIRTARTWGIALWDGKKLETDPKSELVTFVIKECFDQLTQVVDRIFELPFYLADFGTLFREAWDEADYPRWGFGRSHIDHGWGCAFRGAGHDRLVSRRWLDFGPWRVIRRPNDTTFIQFHDLAITDPVAAYEQAKVGHQRMGIDPIGGYIQGIDLDVIAAVRGVYQPAERTLEIVVGPGNSVRQQDMRVACGLRLHHRLTKPTTDRVDHVAYVFMAREDAQAHLHELWLRELQCWYVDERGKHRLDASYQPTPQPPAWVGRLGESSANDV
ncbi:MAG: hypothetical protein ABIY55_12675 [Kofleriaceae bacterium]